MKTTLALAFALAVPVFAQAATPAASKAPPTGSAQIFQQRTSDGRLVLTDRPSAAAVTERTWLMEREDPVAAKERASEVRRHADAVSERIQRRLDAQQRQADDDLERLRMARSDRGRDDESYPYGYAIGYGYGYGSAPYGWGYRAGHRPHGFFDHRHPGRKFAHPEPRGSRFRGPAMRGSR